MRREPSSSPRTRRDEARRRWRDTLRPSPADERCALLLPRAAPAERKRRDSAREDLHGVVTEQHGLTAGLADRGDVDGRACREIERTEETEVRRAETLRAARLIGR